MSFSVPANRSRLVVILVLSCFGLLFASTAATVLAAGESQRRAAAAATQTASPKYSELDRVDYANASITQLVDSLVEPLFAAPGDGSVELREMLELLRTRSEDTLVWDQYTSVSELLDAFSMPDQQRQLFEQRWHDNYRAADSALHAHDATSAVRLARENLAGARWLLQQPAATEARLGRELLIQGASLLARSAFQGEQPALHTAAQRLTTLAQQSASSIAIPGSMPWVLSNRYDAKQLAAIAGNESYLPAIRIASLTTVLAGACLEQREVLFGPTGNRLRALIAIGDSIRDLPRSDAIVAMHRESLIRITNPRAYMSDAPDSGVSALQTVLHLFVPPTVRARVQMCRALV